MGNRNKENDEKIVGGDRVTTMNLEDNLGDHTPNSHKTIITEQKSEMPLSEINNFDKDGSAELGNCIDYYTE